MAPEHMEEFLVFTWPPRTPDPNLICLQWDEPKKKKSQITEGQKYPKYPLLMFHCHFKQDTSRGPVT